MTLEVLIARGVAVVWLVCGLSHLLYPQRWAALLSPLGTRDTGGFVLAGMTLPAGLVIVLGHNVWVWDIPVAVTLAGWMATLKSVAYLLFPQAHKRVMSAGGRLSRGVRTIGAVLVILGAITGYDAFFRR